VIRKRWQLYPPAPTEHFARFFDLSPLVVQVLYNRGLHDPAAVTAFLAATVADDNPFKLKGLNEAVARLRQAIRTGEPIAVYGDYDVDGVCATVLLVRVLQSLGGRVREYIPSRFDEGYGLNYEALHKLASQGVRLVVTVDCGVRAVKQIDQAQQLRLDVIVTDHHTVGETLPAAVAVVNPHRDDCLYPYKGLSGVGLAYKLAQGLLRANQRVRLPTTRTDLAEDDLLDLVALGTVVDLAPLSGENRMLVVQGLARLNAPQWPGLRALMAVAGVQPGRVGADTLGYVLGPRLNASGRLEHARTSFQLLVADSEEDAAKLAQQLDDVNRRRQEITLAAYERAREAVADQLPDARLLFVVGKDYPQGVIGLVAGRLADEFYRPAVVVELGETKSKGSARSIPEFDISKALDRCQSLLVKHGGHKAAAGFTVVNENLPALREQLQVLAVDELAEVELRPTLHIDAEMPLAELRPATFEMLEQLAPFGQDNPPPLLVSRHVVVRDRRLVGNGHLKLGVSDGGVVWDAIAFRQAELADSLARHIDLVYRPEISEWNGEKRFQLNVQDLQPSSDA
jgi:single-stranded-DNA-specific exonuclease